MNIYQPYTQIEGGPSNLHLKAGNKLQRILFIRYRVMPAVIILAAMFVILSRGASHIPMAFNYLLVAAALVSLILLFRPYATGLEITGENIFITHQTITGTRRLTIAVAEAAYISVYENGATGLTTEFVLYTKEKQRFTLLSVPFGQANKNGILLIAQTLGQLLPVEIKLTGLRLTAARLQL